MTNQHTPIPWEVREEWDGDELIWRGVYGPTGGLNTGEQYEIFSEADAHLIVTAVNHHAELLEALETIAKGEGAYNRDPLKHAENTINAAIETANAVLAKVRGE